jgi:hypothetical protein
MRTKNVFLGCTLALLVLSSPGTTGDRSNASTCTAIQVSAPDAPAPKRRPKKVPTFSASAILDLKIEAGLSPALKGQHQMEFKVYTPKGHLYQNLPAAMSAPAPSGGGRQKQSPKRAFSALLPVAGTTIVTSSLYGQWRVEAFLDGERDRACAQPLKFTIEP